MVISYQKMVIFKYDRAYLYLMNAEDKVFHTFFELRTNKLYYNQIREYSHLSHSSLQNILKKLQTQQILEQEKTKSNMYYQIKDTKYVSLKLSQIAVSKFNNLNLSVKIPLKHFLKNMTQDAYTIILFGSASRKEEKMGSDIDIVVVSNKKIDLLNNKKEAELTSKYPLSVFYSTIKQFITNKDDIIIQARKTGFPIYKEQNFYEEILNGYQ